MICADNAHPLGNKAIALHDLTHSHKLLSDVFYKLTFSNGQRGKHIGQRNCRSGRTSTGGSLFDFASMVQLQANPAVGLFVAGGYDHVGEGTERTERFATETE